MPVGAHLALISRGDHARTKKAKIKLVVLGVGVLLLALVATGAIYLLTLPAVGDAEARVQAILDAHGGTVEPAPPPARLAEAAVAVEDEHFYSNVAVNIADGAGRAALATLQGGGDPGGSTIDQQLAKLLYPHESGLGGTLEEIGLAVKLSLEYSSQDILSMYLNAAYFGNGYWGDAAAARRLLRRLAAAPELGAGGNARRSAAGSLGAGPAAPSRRGTGAPAAGRRPARRQPLPVAPAWPRRPRRAARPAPRRPGRLRKPAPGGDFAS